jgi:hypothetical protein
MLARWKSLLYVHASTLGTSILVQGCVRDLWCVCGPGHAVRPRARPTATGAAVGALLLLCCCWLLSLTCTSSWSQTAWSP